MCFSPTASFITAGALAVVGVAAIKKTKTKSERAVAVIPLIFAVQQLIEGVIWLCLKPLAISTCPLVTLTDSYLFFALFWWPFYFPLAASLIEPKHEHKKALQLLSILGLIFALYMWYVTIKYGIPAHANNYNINYFIVEPTPYLFRFLYAATTIGAGLASSHQLIRLYAVLATLFGLISWLLYGSNFPSVWCFFGAILSVLIYWHFYSQQKLAKFIS